MPSRAHPFFMLLCYLQIVDRLMDEIVRRVYREDERVPSVRDYAVTLEVNANTVARSYEYLQQSEIIYNKRGLGYFVCPGAAERILKLRRIVFLKDELPEFFRQMTLLGISVEEIVRYYAEFRETEHL